MTVDRPKPAWLWVTAELTDDLNTGGLVYSFEFAEAVASAGIDVTVIGLCAPGWVSPDRWPFRSEPVVGRGRGGLRSVLSSLPNMTFGCTASSSRRRLRAVLASQSWSAIVIDSLRASWAMPIVEAHGRSSLVFITQNHEGSFRRDVASEATNPVRRALLHLDALKACRLEVRTLRSSNVVTSITDADRARFVAEAPNARHLTLPPGWSGETPARSTPMAERNRRVALVGSFDWHVKQENLRRFLAAADEVFADAGIELVVGGRMPDAFRRSIEPRLRATTLCGWVEDLGDLLGDCRIGVVSEPLGGGFKMKTLDYVFRRVPVAALQGCVAGMPLVDDVSIVTATDEHALVGRIVHMIDDVDALSSIADNALVAGAEAFSWRRGAERLIDAVGV